MSSAKSRKDLPPELQSLIDQLVEDGRIEAERKQLALIVGQLDEVANHLSPGPAGVLREATAKLRELAKK